MKRIRDIVEMALLIAGVFLFSALIYVVMT